MARTLQEINNELRSNFVNNPEVQSAYGLIPGQTFEQQFSIVSIEALRFYTIAFSIWSLENIFDDHKAWVLAKEQSMKPWNLFYLVKKSKEFQYGDTLVEIDDKYQYATINPATQIVKLANAKEGSIVVLKVAKMNSSDDPEELSVMELDAFKEYIRLIKPPGVKIGVVSRPADLLKVSFNIYINPLVLNTSGELLANPSVKPVEDAINNYCKNLPFNGDFSITGLTDAIQQAEGVLNPVFQSAEAQYGLEPYVAIVDYYNPNAGYLKIDPAFPLSSSITYSLLP